VGFAFFGGAETPMLSRKKLNPLRSESRTLIVFPLPIRLHRLPCHHVRAR
jgi:hypothetical protein